MFQVLRVVGKYPIRLFRDLYFGVTVQLVANGGFIQPDSKSLLLASLRWQCPVQELGNN